MPILNFKTFGQGQPIVILHGLFGMLDNWKSFAKRLSTDYSVYLLDLRNHGKSEHMEEMSYQSMAQDVVDFMEKEWIHQAYLVGHSMGGKVAMKVALEHGDSIEKLMILDIAPKPYSGGHEHIFTALFNLPIESLESRKEGQAMLESQIDDLGTVLFLMKNLKRNKQGGFQWKFNLPAIHNAYSEILSWHGSDEKVEIPTLFVKGGKSNYIQDFDTAVIRKTFVRAEISTIDQADHWLHVDAPDELFALLIDFFEAAQDN